MGYMGDGEGCQEAGGALVVNRGGRALEIFEGENNKKKLKLASLLTSVSTAKIN